MKLCDLGELRGPILAFGGPYSNLQATDALIAKANALEIPTDRVICTGDVVAYCGQPIETIARIKAMGCPVIAGNCERQLADDAEDCGCGFEEGSTCDQLSTAWYANVRAQMTPQHRDWMRALPDILTFSNDGLRFAVIHGGVKDISRFIWPCDPDSVFESEFSALGDVDVVISGHSGIAFSREIGGKTWINAGVIGMPPNDGRFETRYAIVEGRKVVFHRLSYDQTAAAAAMEKSGLTQGYHTSLQSGWWPSEDVLPPALRR